MPGREPVTGADQSPNTTDELLRHLIAQVEALRGEIAGRLGPKQNDEAGELLLAIRDAIGSRLFTAAELLRHAELAKSTALRLAMTSTGCTMNARSIGKLLASIEGQPLNGRRAVRVGTERSGTIWRVDITGPL